MTYGKAGRWSVVFQFHPLGAEAGVDKDAEVGQDAEAEAAPQLLQVSPVDQDAALEMHSLSGTYGYMTISCCQPLLFHCDIAGTPELLKVRELLDT